MRSQEPWAITRSGRPLRASGPLRIHYDLIDQLPADQRRTLVNVGFPLTENKQDPGESRFTPVHEELNVETCGANRGVAVLAFSAEMG